MCEGVHVSVHLHCAVVKSGGKKVGEMRGEAHIAHALALPVECHFTITRIADILSVHG